LPHLERTDPVEIDLDDRHGRRWLFAPVAAEAQRPRVPAAAHHHREVARSVVALVAAETRDAHQHAVARRTGKRVNGSGHENKIGTYSATGQATWCVTSGYAASRATGLDVAWNTFSARRIGPPVIV